MSKKKATVANIERVLENILTQVKKGDKVEKKVWADHLNDMLDTLRDDDFFGTEGQLDPRGDNRE